MPTLILGLTGQIGSGKGYICEYLERAYGARVFKFSTYLSRALDLMALEQSRDNLIKMSEALRSTFGEQALSYAVARDAVQTKESLAIIDGIRRIDDLAALEPLPSFQLAAVEADAKIRYGRVANRGEKTDEQDLSWEDFQAQEQRSTEVTVPETMARATLRITNEGTTAALEHPVDALMEKFGIKKVSG